MADAGPGGMPPRSPWEERLEYKRRRWEQKMERRRLLMERAAARGVHSHPGFGGAFIGMALAAIGVLLLLQNLGFVFVENLWDYWPVLLIIFGAVRAAHAWGTGGRIWGGIIAAVGALLLLRNLDLIHVNVWNLFWPVILILVGLGMILRRFDSDGHWNWWADSAAPGVSAPPGTSPVDTVGIHAIFTGMDRRFDTQQFEGGEITAIFGGVQLDLRKTVMKADRVRIDCNAICGGIEIRVPETWRVILHGTGIFGGYSDETQPPPQGVAAPALLITGAAVFGGVNVKN